MNIRRASVQYNSLAELVPDEIPYLKKIGIRETLYKGKPCFWYDYEHICWIGGSDGDLPNGPGIFMQFEPKKIVMITTMKKGIKDGQTRVYLDEDLTYDVTIKRNVIEGNVECYNSKKKIVFKGSVQAGNVGKIIYSNGEVYIGEHFYFLRNGTGRLYQNDSQNVESIIYDGAWNVGKFTRGFAKQEYYNGEIEDGYMSGQGSLFYDKECQRRRFVGSFFQNLFHGHGTEFNPDQSMKYEGFFLNGLFDGEGTLYINSNEKLKLKGTFIAGKAHGKIDVYDNNDLLSKKVFFEDGDAKETLEEYFYNIKLISYSEITNEEVKKGSFETISLEKVVALHDVGSIRYFAKINDLTPCFLGQLNSREFDQGYNGVLAEGGNLFHIGGFRKISFFGQGVLRYNTKNEPKKYDGNFNNGLMDGEGQLFYSNGKPLYFGTFFQNRFNGKGILHVYDIEICNNFVQNDNQFQVGSFEADKYKIAVEGSFNSGAFEKGVLRYSGMNDSNEGTAFILQVNTKFSQTIQGRLYQDEYLVYEGSFEHYTFNGIGKLFYAQTRQLFYSGSFKAGRFDGQGELYDQNGSIIFSGSFVRGAYQGPGVLKLCKENLIYEGEFEEGKISGFGKIYESGSETVRSQGKYRNGQLTQGYTQIYEQGKLKYVGNINEGLYEGRGIEYTVEGQVALEGEFKAGILQSGYKREFFSDGSIFKEGPIVEGNYEGLVNEFYNDGRVLFQGHYKGGNKNGQGTIFHRNGKPKQKGLFQDGAFYDGQILLYFDDTQIIKLDGHIQGLYLQGIGKRYFESGILEYEGEFKNGQFEGEGTYYYPDGRVKFKGKFSEGSTGGFGSYYNQDGVLIYQGEMVGWKKNGKGILYSKNGELLQEGIFQEDELYKGTGKSYWPGYGTLKYKGNYDNGFQEGEGTSFYTNGNIHYSGIFKLGRPHGAGMIYSETENRVKYYEGEFSKGLFNGKGKLYEKNETFIGCFVAGKREGEGILISNIEKIGTILEGRWKNDNFEEGKAYLRFENGSFCYIGGMLRGGYDGQGTKYYENGRVEYEGEWRQGQYEGYGTKYATNGQVDYVGNFDKGFKTGKGSQYNIQGKLIYEGSFLKGAYHGQGIQYDENDFVIYEGSFYNNERTGRGTLFFEGTNQIKYNGDFLKGEFEGNGEKYSKIGYRKYLGGFIASKFNGDGILYYPDGKSKKYVGGFKLKKYNKEGVTFDEAGNAIYKGSFENGEYNGRGTLFFPISEKIFYEGEFCKGNPEGKGIFRYEESQLVKYKGSVKGGKYHGQGGLYLENGGIMCEGEFANGQCCHGIHSM